MVPKLWIGVLSCWGEMFEGDSADTCTGKFPLMSMGGRAEDLACTEPGVRNPISVSRISKSPSCRPGSWSSSKARLCLGAGKETLVTGHCTLSKPVWPIPSPYSTLKLQLPFLIQRPVRQLLTAHTGGNTDGSQGSVHDRGEGRVAKPNQT